MRFAEKGMALMPSSYFCGKLVGCHSLYLHNKEVAHYRMLQGNALQVFECSGERTSALMVSGKPDTPTVQGRERC